jgi:hypothetical protein
MRMVLPFRGRLRNYIVPTGTASKQTNKQARKHQTGFHLRFHIPKAASMKMAVFWVVAIALMMKVGRASETSVNFYQTTRRNNPEDSHLLAFI